MEIEKLKPFWSGTWRSLKGDQKKPRWNAVIRDWTIPTEIGVNTVDVIGLQIGIRAGSRVEQCCIFVRCCGCFMFVTGHWTLISLFMSDMSLWVAKCQVNMSASIEIWTSVTIYIYLAACNLTSQMNVSQYCLKKLYTFNRNYCVLVSSWGQCKEWSDDAVWGRSILLDFDVIHDNGHMTRPSWPVCPNLLSNIRCHSTLTITLYEAPS